MEREQPWERLGEAFRQFGTVVGWLLAVVLTVVILFGPMLFEIFWGDDSDPASRSAGGSGSSESRICYDPRGGSYEC